MTPLILIGLVLAVANLCYQAASLYDELHANERES